MREKGRDRKLMKEKMGGGRSEERENVMRKTVSEREERKRDKRASMMREGGKRKKVKCERIQERENQMKEKII